MSRRLLLVTAALACAAAPALALDVPAGTVLSASQAWTAVNSPYRMLGDVTVAAGATLTIEPGVTVYVATTGRTLTVNGSLKAGFTEGGATDPTKPVLFRGYLNNPNGTPTRGSWVGLVFGATQQGSALANVDLGWASRNIYAIGGSVVVDDSSLHDASSISIQIDAAATVVLRGSNAATGPAPKMRVSNNGGSYAVYNAGTLTASSAELATNTGYGLYSQGNSQVTGCNVRNNSSWGISIANALAGGTQSITRTVLYRNYNGGLQTSIIGTFSHFIDHNTFDDNDMYSSTTYEAQFAISAGTTTVTNNIFSNNKQYGLYRYSSGGVFNRTNNVHYNNTSGASPTYVATETTCNPLYAAQGSNFRITANSPARGTDSTGGDVGALPYVNDPTPGLQGLLRDNFVITAADSPWQLLGDLTVGPNVTLTIQPGAVIRPAATDNLRCGTDVARVELSVSGTLAANGTAALPITIAPTVATRGSWSGVRLETDSGGHVLKSVDIGFGTVGLTVNTPSLSLADSRIHDSSSHGVVVSAASSLNVSGTPATSLIDNNQGLGITSAGTLTVVGSMIRSNGQGGLFSSGNSQITGNEITLNGGAQSYFGVYLDGAAASGTQSLVRNVIHRNGGGGVSSVLRASGQTHLLDHNTLAENEGYSSTTYELLASTVSGATLKVVDNILVGNKGYGIYESGALNPEIHHNLVWGNAYNYTGVTGGTGAVSANPLFVKTDGTNQRITENSPARDADSQATPGDLGALPYINDPTPGLVGTLRQSAVLTKAGSPYQMTGDVVVPAGLTLTLEAGARIVAATGDAMVGGLNTAQVELIVQGRLVVNGTRAEPVVIAPTNATTPGQWEGLRFEASSANNTVSWLDLGAGGTCVQVDAPGVTLTNARIHDCTRYGVYVSQQSASLTMTGDAGSHGGNFELTSSVTHTGTSSYSYPGIYAKGPLYLSNTDVGTPRGYAVQFDDLAVLLGNRLHNSANYFGVRGVMLTGKNSRIERNLVYANYGGGLYLSTTSPGEMNIDHNTLASNRSYGIYVAPSSSSGQSYKIRNNIVAQTTGYGIYKGSGSSSIGTPDYNVLNGNTSGNLSGFLSGSNNVLLDPKFNHPTLWDYRLQPGSPAIDQDDATPAGDIGALSYVDIDVGTLTVTPANPAAVKSGSTQAFTAQAIETWSGFPVNGLPYAWALTAGGGSIASSGVFTAGCTLGTFASTVQATANGVSGRTGVTVVAGNAASVVVTPDPTTIGVSQNTTFSAVTQDACGNTSAEGVNWTVTNASAGVIGASGFFTSSVNAGTFTDAIKATSKITGVTGFATITVTPAGLSAIVVSPANAGLLPGTSGQFTASGRDQWNNPVPVTATWSLAAGCTLGSINASTGVFTAGAAAGTCTSPNGIIATQGTIQGTATVRVTSSPLASITVSPASQSVTVNRTFRFTAAGLDGAGQTVVLSPTWSVPAAAGTIDAGGNLTAGCTPGTYAVTATQGSVVGAASVTIGAGSVASVVVSPATATVALGATQAYGATGKDACGNNVALTPAWAVVAGGGTISTTGVFAPTGTIGTYTNTIRASAGALNGFASVSVTAGPLASITITPASATLIIGGGQTFSAAGQDAAGNTVAFVPAWSMAGSGGTITGAGVFTAGMTAGTFASTVRVTGGAISARASVTVTAGPATSLVITPAAAAVAATGFVDFTAAGRDDGNNVVPLTVAWSVAAGGGTIAPSGRFTAGTLAGNFPNTVRAVAGSFTTLAGVTVGPGPLASFTLDPPNPSLAIGQSQQFSALGEDAWGNNVNAAASWSVVAGGGSINPATGLFIAGTLPGVYGGTIKATSGAVTASTGVTVVAGPLSTITIAAPLPLKPRQTFQFVARGTDSAGNTVSVTPTWSLAASGGTLSATGLFTAGTVAGTFTNTVKAASGSVAGFATVVIEPGAAESLVVTPSDVSMAIFTDQTFVAKGLDGFGNAAPVSVAWSVLTSGGTISPLGVYRSGGTPGRFVGAVRAQAGSLFATASLTITTGAVASIVVSPSASPLGIGDTHQFTAVGEDAAGNVVAFTPSWSTENGGGNISGAGLFTAGTRAGTFVNTITARSGSAVGRTDVSIRAGAPSVLEITPSPATLRVRSNLFFAATATDFYGNSIPSSATWSVAIPVAGTIDASGRFTSGPTAGRYEGAVVAKFANLTAVADVTLTPGNLLEIIVSPDTATLKAGDKQLFLATGKDLDGNVLPLIPTWTALNNVGTIASSGELTAGAQPGVYANAIQARSGAHSGFATVTVTPADVVRVELSPESPRVAMGRKLTFTARAFGVRNQQVFGVDASYAVVAGGGTVDAVSGVFTAGTVAGTFANTVEATMAGLKGTQSLVIPQDNDNDGIDDAWEVAHLLDVTDPSDSQRDPDNDGLGNLQEFRVATDPRDADSDDDGVRDGSERNYDVDLDSDGLVNALDPDSDGDGLFDGTEMAVAEPLADTNLEAAHFVADLDPSTSTDPTLPDTDGDTLADGYEDWSHDGRLDERETDPNEAEPACTASTDCATGRYCIKQLCLPARPCVPACAENESCGAGGICELDDEPRERSVGCACGASDAGFAALLGLGLAAMMRRRRTS